MKKLFLIIAVAILSFALLSACGTTPSQESSTANNSSGVPEIPEGTDGTFDYEYVGLYRRELRQFDGELFKNVCGAEAFDEWIKTFNRASKAYDPNKRPNEDCNLITFIKDFQVSKEKFKTYTTALNGESAFTDAEIDLMYSGTAAEQAAAFANPNAIVVGEAIYTPKWLATHSAQEIRAAGITTAMLEAKSTVWQESLTATQVSFLTQAKTSLQAVEQQAAQ